MNILFLIPSLANGGQEKAGMVLCNYLMHSHSVTVVCLEAPALNEFDYHPPVIRIIPPPKKSLLGKLSNIFIRARSLKKIKQQLNPDVSIAFGNTAIILNAFAGGKEEKIASVRQSLKGRNGGSITARIHQMAYQQALKRSNKIVPVSNAINKELKELFNIDNALFVHNGCNPGEINEKAKAALPEGWNLFFNHKVIAHMGRFDASKCHWELVKVFELVKHKIPTAKLLLLGGIDHSDPVNERIYHFCLRFLKHKNLKIIFSEKQYTADELITADVLVAGHQPNPFPLLSQANIFAFPSAWEGFPNSILEAMALGLVVVSADCDTGPREILTADSTAEQFGYLLPVFEKPFNEHDSSLSNNHIIWADVIVNLLDEREMLHQFAKRALLAVTAFDHGASNKKWNEIIEGPSSR